MKIGKVWAVLFSVSILISITSCDSSTSGPPGFSGPSQPSPGNGGPACKSIDSFSSVQELHNQVAMIRREGERLQHHIEDQIKGFGGLYLDENGAYVVYLQDSSDETVLNSVVSSLKTNRFKNKSERTEEVIIKRGEFSFGELALWRELVTAFLLASSEYSFVTSVHIHEKINRVVIGINSSEWTEESVESVRTYLEKTLLIPAKAVVFEEEFEEHDETDDYDFSELTGDTYDRQRPIVGGLRIYSESSTCSLGFLGIFDEMPVFVTNGHCTENPHGNSSTFYHQGDRDEPDDAIGTEVADGPQSYDMCVMPNSDCWPCRWSDSALVGIRENTEHARGYIAKTIRKSEDWMVEGSRILDEDDPVFTVVDIQDDILTGMTLHKVGGNSGWTSGDVIRTCVDSRRSRHEIILQCQHRARYATSGGGTSGSPVFKRVEGDFEGIENPVALAGIHRASSNRDQGNGYSAFSPIDGVLKDFEGLKGLAIETDTND
ncbi:MAG: hypothetical protein EA391_00685 [Balneolaceae bacterium]|nr:MAG: hypothetical protein EA391_00685 [Balneolaceae bacterium]